MELTNFLKYLRGFAIASFIVGVVVGVLASVVFFLLYWKPQVITKEVYVPVIAPASMKREKGEKPLNDSIIFSYYKEMIKKFLDSLNKNSEMKVVDETLKVSCVVPVINEQGIMKENKELAELARMPSGSDSMTLFVVSNPLLSGFYADVRERSIILYNVKIDTSNCKIYRKSGDTLLLLSKDRSYVITGGSEGFAEVKEIKRYRP